MNQLELDFQKAQLKEKAAPKSINEEVGFLLRWLDERGDAIRAKLKRDKSMKLPTGARIGKAFSGDQKAELLKAATPAPTRPISSLKTAWRNVKARAGVDGRWHDTRHTLINELAESGAGDQTIMDIAGHVSRQMLSRYSHIRMEAKRTALDAVGTKRKPVPAEKAEELGTAEGTVQQDSQGTGAQKWAQ